MAYILTAEEKVLFNDFFDEHIIDNINSKNTYLKRTAIQHFDLVEVSYGHNTENHVRYFDYPYSKESGKIVDIANDATRGVLPNYSKLDKNTFLDIDKEVANAFDSFYRDSLERGYVIYKFKRINGAPIICQIECNVPLLSKLLLINYFHILYLCSFPEEANLPFSEPIIFNLEHEPDVAFIYFNKTAKPSKTARSDFGEQVITTTFYGQVEKIELIGDMSQCAKEVNNIIIDYLEDCFINPVGNDTTKIKEQNFRLNQHLDSLQNMSASTHAIKTFIGTKMSPLINSLALEYPENMLISRLEKSKNDLLYSAELINLLSKIYHIKDNHEKLCHELMTTGFFDKKYCEINLKTIFQELLKYKEDAKQNPRTASIKKNHHTLFYK